MEASKEGWANLAGSFVGSHLQADGGLVVGFVSLSLRIIQMSPGSISSHSSLTRTLVCPHLWTKSQLSVLTKPNHISVRLT